MIAQMTDHYIGLDQTLAAVAFAMVGKTQALVEAGLGVVVDDDFFVSATRRQGELAALVATVKFEYLGGVGQFDLEPATVITAGKAVDIVDPPVAEGLCLLVYHLADQDLYTLGFPT